MLIAAGLNQKVATVSDRERLSVRAEEWGEALRGLASLDGVGELLLLSTCYRVEVYAISDAPELAAASLRSAFERRAGAPVPLFELRGEHALRHVLRVASSLESAVVGEQQILGQLKEAHQRAMEAGVAGARLGAVLSRVYAVAKRVRTETAIGRAGVSWGSAAATLASAVLGSLRGRRVLVFGAGVMARLSAQHLREQGATLTVVNRTLANAEALAGELGATARPADALEEELLLADVVVSAAPAAPAAFSAASLAAAMRARRRRDLVLVDLAVPRAIEAAAGALDGVWLSDVDDLARLAARAAAERAAAVSHAERIIADALARHAREAAERRAAPVIHAIRAQAAEIAREEVDRTLRRIGGDPELETRLHALANALVSKLLHLPSTKLREATADGAAGDRLLAAAAEMFGVRSDVSPTRS